MRIIFGFLYSYSTFIGKPQISRRLIQNTVIFNRYYQNNFKGTTIFNRTKMTKTTDFEYPTAKRDEKSYVEVLHGVTINDVYRALEDPDAKATQEYVDANNRVTMKFLGDCDQTERLKTKFTQLWNYPKYSVPDRHGDKYYLYINTGLQNQNVLYQQDTLDSEPKVFLDPNALSEDGTVSLSTTSFSDDGNYFTYGLSESGSDWIKIKIRNVKTGEDLPEVLEKIKFTSMGWTKDNLGFFYGKYPEQSSKADGSETEINLNQKLYYHRIGESQDKDVLVIEFPEHPTWRIAGQVSDCGDYLLALVMKDCRDYIIFFCNIKENGDIRGKLKLTQIVHKFESDYEYVTNTGSFVVFRTNKGAPNYRLITIDFNKPEEEYWTTLVPENTTDVLDWAACVNGDKLVLCYIHDVKSVLQVHSLGNGEIIRKLPIDIGTINGFSGDKKYSEIFYKFTSFLTPGINYYYDFAKASAEPKILREIQLQLDGFNSSNYCVEQKFYSSKDGTKIPMFIIQKKKTKEGKQPAPCLLYGYGGFNYSITPAFSITGLMFIDTFDGVLAYANIRGGGEYGEKWHDGGRHLNKQNCFDDFCAAAEYLTDNGYTTNKKIVIQGASNGGLLVGACITQRPELFGAAICQVGVLDMLRYHKFTIGESWASDYGNPNEKKHFDNLLKFSPLHNVRTPTSLNDQYPATLVLTADHDDRVSPLHSLKFVAALHNAIKDCPYQKNPVLLRVDTKAGHGAGKPTTKRIQEETEVLTFLYKTLNLTITE